MPIVNNQLGKKVIVRATANDVMTLAQTALTYGRSHSFNANTGVDSANDFITFAPNPFINRDSVLYLVAAGNTAISGLVNNSVYYVVSANSSGVKLSITKDGTANAINATATSETGHTLKLIEDVVGATVSKVYWSIPDAGTTNYVNVARSTTTLLNLTSSGMFDFSGEGLVIDTGSTAANVNITFVGNQNASCIVELHKQSIHRGDQVL
jgi:hypothetical protein